MTHVTAKAPFVDQSISVNLTVEVMTDPDNGQPMLVAATQGNQGDLQVVTVAQALAKVTMLREQASRIEALVNRYAEEVLIPAFLTAFDIQLEELDIANLVEDAPDLAARFRAFAAVKNDGSVIAAVPKGQPATERLAAIRDLVLDLQKKEQG
ncbi:hypothetical protein ACH4F6_39230 [Streptomyces sp. NPDC017936]|uniref:hypothetical protein n=1 Tax=Streptomyces sp. NPDC017936 TaxID=3365016 RepID=UPI0037994D12